MPRPPIVPAALATPGLAAVAEARDDAATAATSAAASAAAAAASASQAHDISGIDTSDGLVSTLVGTEGSATAEALNAKIAGKVTSALADDDTVKEAAATAVTANLVAGQSKRLAVVAAGQTYDAARVTNYALDPGFEYGVGGVTTLGSVAVEQSTDWHAHGNHSLKATISSSSTSSGNRIITPTVACTGAAATVSVQVYNGSAGARTFTLRLLFTDDSAATTGYSEKSITLTASASGTVVFQFANASWSTSTGFVVQAWRAVGGDGAASGDIFHLDDLYMSPGVVSPLPALPLDGDQDLSYWTSTPGASTSVRIAAAPTPQEVAAFTDAATKSRTDSVAALGDSTVAGGSPGTAAIAKFADLTDKAVYNGGLSGATSGTIGVLHGFVTITTTADFSMPADTTPVTGIATQSSISPCNVRWQASPGDTYASVHGSLGGRAGTITFTAAAHPSSTQTATFAPDSAGTAETVAAGAAFVPDTPAHPTWLTIMQGFTNDATFSAPSHATGSVAAAQALVAALAGDVDLPRILIVPAITAPTVGPASDPSSIYANSLAIRDALVTALPSYTADFRGYLASAQALTDADTYCVDNDLVLDADTQLLRAPTGGETAGFTPTTDDTANVAASMTPPSLMYASSVHPNDLGKALEAQWYVEQLALRGWL